MSVGLLELLETINAADGLDADAQLQRVGIDPDAACDAGIMVTDLAMEGGAPDTLAVATALFCIGLAAGARLAQAGIATPDTVIA